MKTIEQIREEAAAHFNGTKGFNNAARCNAYVCEDVPSFGKSTAAKKGCGSFIVTVDREPGVTPALVTCGNCGNIAGSKFYKVAERLEPTHEWYRPDSLDGLKPGELDHVEHGGLLLRKIGGGTSKEGWRDPDPGRQVKPHASGGGIRADYNKKNPILAELESFAASDAWAKHKAGQDDIYQQQLEVARTMIPPQVNRADYPNRQQYRAAVRRQRKG